MKISALLSVFNEEKRIEKTLNSFLWCDEIIVVDKFSTDDTLKIANQFNEKVKIYSLKNTSELASEVDFALSKASFDWIILVTASDLIHPKLAFKIRNNICSNNFDSDILHIPFRRFVLGINSKRSPWGGTTLNPVVIRKTSIFTDKSVVHGAIKFVGKHFYFSKHETEVMYHLTHENMDLMMDRFIRYWKAESFSVENINLKNTFNTIFKAFISLFFKKKTWLLGYDGIMLICLYLSYLMMSFVFKWEKLRSNSSFNYSKIKDEIDYEWKNYKF
jgi:glycosyltransferase involved in cell wall biosynthesis